MRRSPIRRTGPPKRNVPLRSTTGLTRSGPPRPVSDKRRAEQRERRKEMIEAFGPDPDCAIRWDERCRGKADAPHELRKRSQGGSIVDPANAVPACHPCNSAVEDNPAEAWERGWVVRSWEGGP